MLTDGLPLCCFGAGGHGRVVARQWLARERGAVVFADENLPIGAEVDGIPILFSSLEEVSGHALIVTLGDNINRRARQATATASGLRLATFVADPQSYLAAPPGAGSMILAGAVVNPGANLSDGVIVNTNAVVEHDCEIGAFAHISPGAVIAGGCRVGAGSWIGAGATLVSKVAIAPGTVIGAGSTVIRSLPEPGVYVGVPVRRIR